MGIVAKFLLVVGLFAAVPALAQQEPPARVGRVSAIEGTLAFYGAGDSEWSAAQVNLPVATGGWFATDPRSRAQLRIGADAIILANDSQLNIADLRDGVMQLALSQGRIGLQLRRPAWRKEQTAEIDIARGGLWLLQPGDYDVDSGAPDQPTRITVFEGSARFVGGGIDQIIKAGQRLVLTGADTLTAAVQPAEPDDFTNWCRDHGIRQDRVASARHVSPAMTGFEELEPYGEWGTSADYGAVWYPKSLPADWAPYRAGRWVWVEPWGWNWIDDEPWGFAPFHYGRWAQVDDRWGWVPGEFVAQPVYAPALVAFIPQPVVEVAVAADAGPPVGWFPLAPGEVYWPSYTRNPTYIRNVNITNVRINVINRVTTAMLTRRGMAEPPPAVLNQHFANRGAATVVPAHVVVSSSPVAPASMRVTDRRALRQAKVAALPPPVVARPAGAAASQTAAAAPLQHGRMPPGAQPPIGAPSAAAAPQRHHPERPNFAQLARAPRLGHSTTAAVPASLPAAAPVPAPSSATAPGKPAEAPAATAAIPPLVPHHRPGAATPGQPAADVAPTARPGPPGRPDFANLPRWRPHGPAQHTAEAPVAPQGAAASPAADEAAQRKELREQARQHPGRQSLPAPPEAVNAPAGAAGPHAADRAARQRASQELAQQRAAAAEAARQRQAEQRAARQQAVTAQQAQQRAASEAVRQQQAAQRAARQQAVAAQQAQHRAAAEAARQQQAQQRAAADAARQQQAQQRAAQQQAMAAKQAQQRAAHQAAAQQAAAQRAAQQAAAQQQAQQRAAQQQAMAAQQAQQRAAQQAAAQQAAAQRAAQQQAMAAQQAQQRAAQQAAAQQAASQRAAQQQAAAAQQRAQQAAAQQQKQKGGKEAHACGAPGLPACPQH